MRVSSDSLITKIGYLYESLVIKCTDSKRAVIRDLHFSVSKFVSNFETVSNVKILVVNSLNIWDTVL